MSTPICASRECFCLYSRGDNPKLAIGDNHRKVLAEAWNFYPEGEFSTYRACISPFVYLMGMVYYLFETVFTKVLLALGNTLAYCVSLCRDNEEWRWARGVICLDSWATLGIGIVGILIPPLAYKLEALTEEAMLGLLEDD